MSVERLERVMWRLRKNIDTERPLWKQLRRAIMYECGTDPRTYLNNKRALIALGWITSDGKHRFRLTNEDLRGG